MLKHEVVFDVLCVSGVVNNTGSINGNRKKHVRIYEYDT